MGAQLEQALQQAAEHLRYARRVAVLTGAGVSAESGVPTFRMADGLWEGHRIEEVATPQGFHKNPELVWQFYNARRAKLTEVRPNPGHHALSQLEQRFGDQFTLITQNVDGLHQRAGNLNVVELHGCLSDTICLNCGDVRDQGAKPLGTRPVCSLCGGYLRPKIVWFGEMLPPEAWRSAQFAAEQCDVMLVVGTSAVVHPAASLIPIARNQAGDQDDRSPAVIIECNLTHTDASLYADVVLLGPSGETLPRLVKLLEQQNQ